MSVSIVARRYAQALLDLGVEQNQLDAIVAEVESVAAAVEQSADFRNALENPLVAHGAKKAVMTEVAKALGASSTTKNAMLLLVDRRRTAALPYIARSLRQLADARRGVVRAEVTTAAPLSEAFYGRLQTELERLTGMHIVMDRRTDTSLIGGVVTRIGDRIFDGSLRTRLHSLREALLPTT